MSFNNYSPGFAHPLLLFATFLCVLFVKAIAENGGFTVDLIHRDASISPSYNPSSSHFQRLKRAFDRSFQRKLYFKKASSGESEIKSTVKSAIGEYLMEINIGNPPVKQYGIADTGSDLTWMQCKPCTKCYRQRFQLFSPKKTKTFKKVSCKSATCATAGGSSCGNKDRCRYQVSYGDQSYSVGDLAVDTFTFDSSEKHDNLSFPKVVFGCGHENVGVFSDTGSGIIGLGGGPTSIVNQLNTSIGGRFSYCLTPVYSNSSSRISFGRNAIVEGQRGSKVLSTPMAHKPLNTFYYLTLDGISVGTKRIEYKSIGRLTGDNDSGNIIIDSGTTLTFIASDAYERVESALIKSIKAERVQDKYGTFNLCYKVSENGQLDYPAVTMHFRGADVSLPKGSTFLITSEEMVCLTLMPSTDIALFGNLHQIDYHVGYDLVNGVVNFLQTDCSKY